MVPNYVNLFCRGLKLNKKGIAHRSSLGDSNPSSVAMTIPASPSLSSDTSPLSDVVCGGELPIAVCRSSFDTTWRQDIQTNI